MVDVLVVDDNEIERCGRELLLTRRGHRVEATDWAEVDSTSGTAAVVLAVVRRDPTAFDRWHRLRRTDRLDQIGRAGARVVALTADPTPVAPLAMLRLRQAGASSVLVSSQVSSGDLLDALVRVELLDNSSQRSRLGRLIIGSRCNPGAVVEHVLTKAEGDDAYLRAFDPGVTQNGSGLSRRRAHTLRVKVSALGDIRPAMPCAGGPVRDLSLPRWSDMVDFVNACRLWDAADAGGPEHLVLTGAR